MDHKKELVKLFKSLAPKYNLYNIFGDFCKLGAIACSNSVDKAQFEKREEQYMQTIKKYTRDEANKFGEMLAILTAGLTKKSSDLLGETYMELGISNDDQGQFFTPYNAAELMAELAVVDAIKEIDANGYVNVNEPTVGGGVTIIALANSLKKRGYNYQKCMKVVAQEIDVDLVHMCYLQFSLLGIDAEVLRGDTLAYKFDDFWYTPIHIFNRLHEAEMNKEQLESDKRMQKMQGIITEYKKFEKKRDKVISVQDLPIGQASIFDFI